MLVNDYIKVLITVSLLTFSQLSTAQEDSVATTIEGLQLIDDTQLALVYAEPDIDLGQYQRIYLDAVHVAFKKNWKRDKNRSNSIKITNNDMARIKSDLATLFHEVFSETLQEGGYELTTERADDVLLVLPAIINLDIAAPDIKSANRSHTFAESAGEMTLYMELHDSVTGDLIAKALDRQLDRRTGFFQWQSQVSNRAAAKRIMQVWANVLKEGLDDARSTN
jgi:hypothetical protein